MDRAPQQRLIQDDISGRLEFTADADDKDSRLLQNLWSRAGENTRGINMSVQVSEFLFREAGEPEE